MFDPSTLTIALEVAIKAAKAAAGPIMERFRTPELQVETKGDGSPVSEADKAAEAAIRETLKQAFPGIPILGEEEGHQGAHKTPLRWVVDPIDGTISYVRGVPLFGTIIGLEDVETGEALAGVIHLPALNETYSGGKGLGCFCNGARIDVGAASDAFPGLPDFDEEEPDFAFQQILVGAGDPLQFRMAASLDDHGRLAEAPLLRGYSDCFGHAMVLRGAVGVMVDPWLSEWDLVATRAMIGEAKGAIFTRPSVDEGKVDAIIGRPDLVDHVARTLGWKS